jgi:hypothetical protein
MIVEKLVQFLFIFILSLRMKVKRGFRNVQNQINIFSKTLFNFSTAEIKKIKTLYISFPTNVSPLRGLIFEIYITPLGVILL